MTLMGYMGRTLLVALAIWGLMLTAFDSFSGRCRLHSMPAYELSKTADGELGVECLNGADATVRPSPEFGHITVSCGK